MKSPFPGMDPYLEHPALWPDVHNRLITALADFLSPLVAPRYYVGVESRAYVVKPEGDHFLGRPDIAVAATVYTQPTPASPMAEEAGVLEVELPVGDEISHYYLEIREAQTHELITAIELLSPANKVDRRGRFEYLAKRDETLASLTNLIEIDLLRAGEPMPLNKPVSSDYRILVSRGWTRRKAQLYAFGLRAPIPDFPVPLQQGEKEPLVTLNQVLHALYGRARFDLRIDYTQPPTPPLPEAYMDWVSELLEG
jgi:hypothetical protein